MKSITYVRFADLGLVKTAIVKKDPLSIMLNAAPPTKIVVPTRPICNPKPVVIRKHNSIPDIKYAVFADLGPSESPVAKNDPLSVIRRAQVVSTMPTNHSLMSSKLPAERTKKPHKSAMFITCARFEELGMLKPVADNEPFYWMKPSCNLRGRQAASHIPPFCFCLQFRCICLKSHKMWTTSVVMARFLVSVSSRPLSLPLSRTRTILVSVAGVRQMLIIIHDIAIYFSGRLRVKFISYTCSPTMRRVFYG